MSWQNHIKGDPLPWLMEEEEPGVRYLALRDLLDRPEGDKELAAARRAAHQHGPIAGVLDGMHGDGYWLERGSGYNPKYRSGVWSIILLAQLGARSEEDERIRRACAYMLEHNYSSGGQFSTNGAPSGTVDCVQGNLCWALLELGCQDPRLDQAYEWMARSVTGEGIAPQTERDAPVRFYAGKCGPDFTCGANNKLACAWGAVKVMLAFASLAEEKRTPLIRDAIRRGVDFLLSADPASADYPHGYNAKPSQNWWKFGFPVFYITDILQIVEALAGLGYGSDARLEVALALVESKQDEQGRWALEYDYAGKTWGDYGSKKQPNKWVTLRALRAIKAAYTT